MTKLPSTQGSLIYKKIKRDIIFGELKPGEKLKLNTLKQRYNTSLPTLRETLNRLSSEEFVIAPENRGFFVAPVSKEDLTEIANLRVLLECHALEMSIENGDTEWEGNLVSAHYKLQLLEKRMISGDISEKETWKRYDWEFHLALIQACKSKNLLSLHSTLFDKYLRYQLLVLTHRGKQAEEEHRAMFEAALARDSSIAKELLKIHILNGLSHTITRMA